MTPPLLTKQQIGFLVAPPKWTVSNTRLAYVRSWRLHPHTLSIYLRDKFKVEEQVTTRPWPSPSLPLPCWCNPEVCPPADTSQAKSRKDSNHKVRSNRTIWWPGSWKQAHKEHYQPEVISEERVILFYTKVCRHLPTLLIWDLAVLTWFVSTLCWGQNNIGYDGSNRDSTHRLKD